MLHLTKKWNFNNYVVGNNLNQSIVQENKDMKNRGIIWIGNSQGLIISP